MAARGGRALPEHARRSDLPRSKLRGDRSEVHLGSFVLDFHGPANGPGRFDGEYWTDRRTRGSMSGRRVTKELHSTYAAAVAAVGAG